MKRIDNKKNLYKSIILLVVLVIGIGYAYLTSNLSISGQTEVVANTWNIHFENLNVKDGSVTASTPATIDSNETSIEYAITLSRPKDFYEFTVDVKNDGTLPGKVSISSLSGITTEASSIIDYSIKYTYGQPVNVGDILNGGATKTIKVKVYYKDDINADDFPENNLNLNLTYTLQYIQSDKDEEITGTILQNLSSNNSCITKYEGAVTDSVGITEEATNVYFDKCSDKRNIVFGGFCWQAIRTTETGGLKMIYNGEPVDGKCESSRESHLGLIGTAGASTKLNVQYKYGDSFTYDTTNNSFTLLNTMNATWSDSTYEDLIGKFTCKNNSINCTNLFSINGYNTTDYAYTTSYTIGDTNYAQIGSSPFNANSNSLAMGGYMFNSVYNRKSKSLQYIEYVSGNTYSYGPSYTENGDGSYTINGATNVSADEWAIDYNNATGYICKNPVNDTCNDVWSLMGVSSVAFLYYKKSNTIKIGKGFSYSNGIYTLIDTKDYWQWNNSDIREDIRTHHYTCWNNDGTCNSISYIFQSEEDYYYIDIQDGKSVENVINEMLSDEEVNLHNSSIKGIVDNWYAQNLINKKDLLEDVVYCNSRAIASLEGWNPDGGIINYAQSLGLRFNSNIYATTMNCINDTDQFAVSNKKAELSYPLALISSEEIKNIDNMDLIKTGTSFYTMSPSVYSNRSISEMISNEYGTLDNIFNSYVNGVRPVISLASFNTISSGTGSETDPWVVD